ncbi:restriction endonuclease subunit S [Bifidobacterium adolescentis]|uniref:restriction endonuclease subunit S n=1 Tax=Bifidobacterium adolescentis TaxID=1680 RepID=UPI0034A23341
MAEQHGKTLVPQIRFAGFTDPWEQRKLGDVATIVGGGTPSTNNDAYWDGDIDWYSPAELGEQVYADRSARRITQAGYDSCSATLLPAGKTILFTSRAGIGNTAILRRSACTNQGFQSLVVNDDTDVYFVYSMTDRIKNFAEQKASGSTFLEISGKGLAAGEFAFPSKDEQTAIGSMFKQLDHLITLHQRKYDKLCVLKKSMLDKMFPKGGSLYPEIRFAGFTDPWEQRKLSSTCEQLSRTINPLETPNEEFTEYSMPAFDNNETAETVIGNSMNSLRKIVDRPCLLVNKLNVRKKRIWHVPRPEANAVCSSEFVPFSSHSSDLSFIKISLLSERITAYLESCSSGSSNSQKRVTPEIIMSSEIIAPSLAEQRRIGAFFDRLDSLITLHQRKLELLRNIKKSMLDKMFV